MRLLVLLALVLGGCGPAPGEDITLAAASSLRRALPELIAASGMPVSATYGGSGSLRRQIAAGAPVDGLLFAGPQHVDALREEGLVGPSRTLATNDLVLIAPAVSDAPWTFATLGANPPGRLAVGDPRTVPAGRYAEETLRAGGTWDAVAPGLIPAADVGAVLTWVRRGEVDVGVVYGTEVIGVDGVAVLDRTPGASTPQVVAATVLAGPGAARADAFFDFVASPAGQAILRRHGFSAASP